MSGRHLDQALMAVLPLHHQSLRLLGLARHVLVVDEVHAYDEYMNALLERLLQFHAAFGGSAILLSATLPMKLRERFVAAYCSGLRVPAPLVQETGLPLMTVVSSRGVEEMPVQANALSRRTVGVELTSDEADVEAYLERALREGRCACWIRNTVTDAIEAYIRLAERWGDEHVKLFHARFTVGDRQEIEDDVLAWFGKQSTEADRRGKVLIATQVSRRWISTSMRWLRTLRPSTGHPAGREAAPAPGRKAGPLRSPSCSSSLPLRLRLRHETGLRASFREQEGYMRNTGNSGSPPVCLPPGGGS